MMISFDHEASVRGRPVFLDDSGRLMTEAEGMRAALRLLGWDRERLAAESGFSRLSVDAWCSGRREPALAALTVLYAAYRRKRSSGHPPTGHA